MQKIEAIIFKDYFMKHFEKLDEDVQDIFYTKLEILENNDYISKKLKYKEHDIDLRCIRVGKFRFIYVLENETRAVFLDIMYRELGYKINYLDKLYKVYKNGN